MTNKEVKCTAIVQQDNRSVAQFQELEKGKPTGTMVQVSFSNPGDAAQYEYGKQYTVTIKKTK